MGYMSYCRFYNTRRAMADGLFAIEEGRRASADEIVEAKRMFDHIAGFVEEYGVVKEYDISALDDRLDELNSEDYE